MYFLIAILVSPPPFLLIPTPIFVFLTWFYSYQVAAAHSFIFIEPYLIIKAWFLPISCIVVRCWLIPNWILVLSSYLFVFMFWGPWCFRCQQGIRRTITIISFLPLEFRFWFLFPLLICVLFNLYHLFLYSVNRCSTIVNQCLSSLNSFLQNRESNLINFFFDHNPNGTNLFTILYYFVKIKSITFLPFCCPVCFPVPLQSNTRRNTSSDGVRTVIMHRVYIGGLLLACFLTFADLVEEYGFDDLFETEKIGRKWSRAFANFFEVFSSITIFHILLLTRNT